MITLDEYLDRAKARNNLGSDRQLAAWLDCYASHVNQYRKGRAFPSVGRMVRIATLAGESPEAAIADLLRWKAVSSGDDDRPTLDVLDRIANAVKPSARTALSIGLAGLVLFSGLDAKALEYGRRLETPVAPESGPSEGARLYIMRNLWGPLRALVRAFLPHPASWSVA